MTETRDEVLNRDGERWQFDEEVTLVFDNMLERSIPQYAIMRETVADVGARFVSADESVLDLGCSRGGALELLLDRVPALHAVGYEVSEPMLDAARRRFQENPRVRFYAHDLRLGVPRVHLRSACRLVQAILTLQFVPINYRQRIIADSYYALADGGALVLVEKVIGNGTVVDELMVDLYHGAKLQAGYSKEQVERKALALEGVLVPQTAEQNELLLRRAGFRQVDCFWAWMNFRAWVAVK